MTRETKITKSRKRAKADWIKSQRSRKSPNFLLTFLLLSIPFSASKKARKSLKALEAFSKRKPKVTR
jgi:hypothetical protein